MQQLDLNCDMGESTHLHHYNIEDDLKLFPFLSSINIACGAHAGDPQTMFTLADHALRAGIAVGAHPGYEDRDNFGRTPMKISLEEIYNLVLSQVRALQEILKGLGKRLHHVKPHGALYNSAAKDPELAGTICQAIAVAGTDLKIYGLAGSCVRGAAEAAGLGFVSEVFADRSYQDDGSLTPRTVAGAVLTDAVACEKQLIDMALHARVKTITGSYVSLKVETICLHSDGAHALELAKLMNNILNKQGVAIRRPS